MSRIWIAFVPSTLMKRTVRCCRRPSRSRTKTPGDGGVTFGRSGVAGLERLAIGEQAGAGLGLAIDADRHDRLLEDADENELLAGADEVQRAVRSEQHLGQRLQAVPARRSLAGWP